MTISDQILYRQILTQAGFRIHAMTGTAATRGSGVAVLGSFERFGKQADSVLVHITDSAITIDGQYHFATVRDDGSFDLFIAHGDRPR